MKFIVLAVVSISVFRASCRERPDGREINDDDLNPSYGSTLPDDRDFSDGDDLYYGSNLPDGPKGESFTIPPNTFSGRTSDLVSSTDLDTGFPPLEFGRGDALDGFQNYESPDIVNHQKEGRKEQSELMLRGKKQDEILSQLSKSLETFKYIMTHAYSELKVEIETIRDHTDNNTAELEKEITELHPVLENITHSNSQLETDMNFMKQKINDSHSMNINMNNTMSLIISKLDSIKAIRGCPSGFFRLTSSNQCFKILTATKMNWTSAGAKCRTEGLELAEPEDPVSVGTYLVKKYGLTSFTYVGGRGDGSTIRWQRGGDEVIPSSSSLWYSDHPKGRLSSAHCLLILTTAQYMKPPYGDTYYSVGCNWGGAYPLCELVISE